MILRDLSVLCYGHGFSMWLYKDKNMTAADLLKPGFFNPAGEVEGKKLLAVGDIIICQAARGCLQVWVSDVSEIGVLVELMCSTYGHTTHTALEDLQKDWAQEATSAPEGF